MIKKFEAYGDYYRKESTYDWRKEFMEIRELFYPIEEFIWDSCGGDIDFQAGFRTSNNSYQYTCFLKDENLIGNTDSIDHACGVYASFCTQVRIEPKFKNNNYSPFKTSYSNSYFGENSIIMLDIIVKVNSIKNRMKEYDIGITFESNTIYINFLRKK